MRLHTFILAAIFVAVIPSAWAQSANLAVDKTGPALAEVESDVAYSITLSNLGPNDAVNVQLTDPIPEGMTFVSATQHTGPAFNCPLPNPGDTGTITCTQVLFPAGSVATFTFVFRIRQPQPPFFVVPGTTFTNTATVTSSTPDPNPDNNSDSVETRTPAADLFLEKSGPLVAPAGSNVSYTVTLRSLGPQDALSVTLSDPTPPGMTFVSATQNSGPALLCPPPQEPNGTITCNTELFPAGGVAVFTFVFQIPNDAPPGATFNNIATVTTQRDPTPENNTAVATTTTPPPPQSDLSVTKSGPSAAGPGTNVTYTVTLANVGPDAAMTVSLKDTLPGTMTFVSVAQLTGPLFNCDDTPAVGAGGEIDCTIATLNAGASATFAFTFAIPGDTPTSSPGNIFVNTAFATTATADPNEENNSASVTTTVSSANLGVTKTGPPTAVAGTNISYTLTFTNAGPEAASGVVVTDTLAGGGTIVSLVHNSGPAGVCSAPAAGPVTCLYEVLGVGTPAQYTLTVNTGGGPSLTNTLTIRSDTFDPAASNDTASVNTAITPQADLSVTKSGPANVVAGTNVTYTITATNNGPSTATSVTLTDSTPPNTTFVSIGQTSGPLFNCTTPAVGGTGMITCTIGSLGATQTTTFSLVLRVVPGAPTGSNITNAAAISSPIGDPNGTNNDASSMATVQIGADVAVTKSGPATVAAGTTASYTVTVVNNGPSDAMNVTLTDTLPPNTTLATAMQTSGPLFNCTQPAAGGTGTISCSIATLATGATATFAFTFNVSAATPPGSLENTATVTSTSNDPTPGNNSSTTAAAVGTNADVTISKTGPATVTAGNNATYTVTARNNGPSDAASVTITDTIPAGTTFVSATQDSGPIFNCTTPAVGSPGTISCTIPTFPNASTSVFTFVVRVLPATPGPISNTAGISSPSDPTPGNNSASAPSAVMAGTTDVSIMKTANGTSFAIGSRVTYTIVVTNDGPGIATGTTVTDVLPAGTTLSSVSTTQGTCTGTTTVTCTIGTLTPLATATITLALNLPQTGGPVANTATVAIANGDTSGANDTSTATLAVNQEIPALSPLTLALLALVLGVAGLVVMRR